MFLNGMVLHMDLVDSVPVYDAYVPAAVLFSNLVEPVAV